MVTGVAGKHTKIEKTTASRESGFQLSRYLLWNVYIGTMIPPRWVKPQLRKSIYNFSKQVSYPNVIKEYESSKLDDYTDALLLAMAGYDGNESFLYKAAD